jgi:predicted metal-binding membrane protein
VKPAAVGIRPAYSPRVWVYLVAGAAMVAVIVEHLQSHLGDRHHQGMTGMPDMAGMSGMQEMHSPAMSLATSWGWWVVMTAAMMLPIVADGSGRVAAASLWRRRHLAVVEYLGGYLSVWSVFGLAAIGTIAVVWPAGVPAAAPAVALLVAAVWQVTSLRKQTLRRCARPPYVNVRGWPADRDCVAAGVAQGRRCVVTCAPVMAVMALAHSVILLLLLTCLLLSERAAGPDPDRRAGRPQEAIVLAGLAFGVAAWAAFGEGSLL